MVKQDSPCWWLGGPGLAAVQCVRMTPVGFAAALRRIQSPGLPIAVILAWSLEHAPHVRSASDDPLALPIVRGKQRSRRIAPALKAAVVREAGAGSLGKSSQQVLKQLRRFCWKGVHSIKASGNDWLSPDVASKVAFWKETLSGVPISGTLCMDATRLGGNDTLWFVVYAPSLDQCVLGPHRQRERANKVAFSNEKHKKAIS